MHYFFYIILGLLPSFIWLSFYLRKDKHPESNGMILRIFSWGIIIAPLAVVLELALIKIILISALVPALVEEYLKYAVVKFKVLKNSEFDEPVDAMLYCIIAGLGFAAVENLLIILRTPLAPIPEALTTIGLRFLGATLVHALASALVGYWLAKGLLEIKKRKRFVAIGLTLAILFHSCYNYFIISYQQPVFILATICLLIAVAVIVSNQFQKLKKQQSICQIK